jgi:hypothetical protein
LAVSVGSGLSSLLRPGSLVILFAVALTGVGLGFKEAEFPKSSIWEPGEPALVALVILGAISYLGSALVIVGYRRSLRRSDQDSRLYRICRDVAALVERKAAGLGRDDIAAHIWTVRGLPGVRRLERRATFLPGDRQSTAILWRKGKGAIGRCWETNQPQLADLEDLAALAPDEQSFYALPPDQRYHFTWEEFRATEHYKAIAVWPLHDHKKTWRVIGCLSVDVQAAGAAAELDRVRAVHRADLSAHLDLCEAVLSRG